MSKTFITELARRIGRDRKATETLIEALSQAIATHCGELDTVAIPSFGNFVAKKHDEQIITNHSTGGKMLLPPEVELTFQSAAKLRKLCHE